MIKVEKIIEDEIGLTKETIKQVRLNLEPVYKEYHLNENPRSLYLLEDILKLNIPEQDRVLLQNFFYELDVKYILL